jgi:hypothetical protein
VKAIERLPPSAESAPRHAAARKHEGLGTHLAALALVALLVPFNRAWSAQVLLVPLLLIVPGVILLRALRVPGDIVASSPVYIPCASIIILFGSGLAVDIVGPLVGLTMPLRTWPLLASFELLCLALLAFSRNAPRNVAIPWDSISPSLRSTWPLILPLIAAAGALRLNSGHSNTVAVAAACSLVALLATIAVLSLRLEETTLKVVLYSAALAIAWSDSLRGDGVYGFDIATEYQRLTQTVIAGVWHMPHANDAYGAMLSVTVMPTELHFLSGVPGLLVFKVVYPMIFALFPIGIFTLARRILSERWAFVAAAFTIGQYAFTEIISVARQEIALVLFVALMGAMLDNQLRRRPQCILVALLALAMALSHYSTAYVAITIVGLMLPLQWATSWFREIPRITSAVLVAFVAALAGAFIWYVPVTHSDSHLLQVAQTVQAQGLNVLPNRTPGGSFIAAYLQGNTKTPIEAAHYEQLIHTYYVFHRPYIKPFADASQPQYALRNAAVPEPPVTWHLGYRALGLGMLLIEQLANVLGALGALMMTLRRGASIITRQLGLLGLVTTLLLTVLRFSGTLAVAYGQERAQLQGLVLLAISLCWVGQSLTGPRERQSARGLAVTGAAAACLAVVLINTSNLGGALLGGGTSTNLANSGAAYEHFYTTAPELASAQWLGKAVPPGQLVYADEYGQLRLAAMTGIQHGLIGDLTPLTLNAHAWVYASRTNFVSRRAFALYNEHLATYGFPMGFLNAKYDLVYSDGSSEVFYR